MDRQGERANIRCVKLDLSQQPENRNCLKTISKDESTRSLERSAPFQLAPNTQHTPNCVSCASLTRKFSQTGVRCQDREHFSTVQYSTVQHSTVWYSTVQYSTVQYSSLYVLLLLLRKYPYHHFNHREKIFLEQNVAQCYNVTKYYNVSQCYNVTRLFWNMSEYL